MKPFSEASERNSGPILAILKRVLRDRKHVLEIGSGTGQHAAYFAPELPHLRWQASDVAENLPGIREWISDPAPIELDVDKEWPKVDADAAFSANTCHILSWPQVQRMFEGIGKIPSLRTFCLYGPFNYGGKYTSESNARFDAMLRRNDPASGLRDFEKINALAAAAGLKLQEDNAMPANNRLLIYRAAPRSRRMTQAATDVEGRLRPEVLERDSQDLQRRRAVARALLRELPVVRSS